MKEASGPQPGTCPYLMAWPWYLLLESVGLWPLGHLGPLSTPDAPTSCPGLPPAKAPDGSESGPPQRAAWGVTARGWGSLRRMLGEGREQGEGKG